MSSSMSPVKPFSIFLISLLFQVFIALSGVLFYQKIDKKKEFEPLEKLVSQSWLAPTLFSVFFMSQFFLILKSTIQPIKTKDAGKALKLLVLGITLSLIIASLLTGLSLCVFLTHKTKNSIALFVLSVVLAFLNLIEISLFFLSTENLSNWILLTRLVFLMALIVFTYFSASMLRGIKKQPAEERNKKDEILLTCFVVAAFVFLVISILVIFMFA